MADQKVQNEAVSLEFEDDDIKIKDDKEPEIKDISITELYNQLQRFSYFSVATKYIDLRQPNEFNKYHIGTSVNVIVKNKVINSLNDLSVIDTIQTCKLQWHLKLLTHEAVIIFIGYNENINLLKSFLFNKYQVTQFYLLKPHQNGFKLFAEKYPFMMIKGDGYKQEDERMLEYPHEIIKDKLYLSNYLQSDNIQIVSNLKITHIVNVTQESHKNKIENIEYYQMSIYDNIEQDILSNDLLLNTVKYIDNILFKNNDCDNNKCIVHCHQGVSRSSTVIIAFLIYKYNVKYDKGLEMVEKIRPRIYPNSGFKAQLLKFESNML